MRHEQLHAEQFKESGQDGPKSKLESETEKAEERKSLLGAISFAVLLLILGCAYGVSSFPVKCRPFRGDGPWYCTYKIDKVFGVTNLPPEETTSSNPPTSERKGDLQVDGKGKDVPTKKK